MDEHPVPDSSPAPVPRSGASLPKRKPRAARTRKAVTALSVAAMVSLGGALAWHDGQSPTATPTAAASSGTSASGTTAANTSTRASSGESDDSGESDEPDNSTASIVGTASGTSSSASSSATSSGTTSRSVTSHTSSGGS